MARKMFLECRTAPSGTVKRECPAAELWAVSEGRGVLAVEVVDMTVQRDQQDASRERSWWANVTSIRGEIEM